MMDFLLWIAFVLGFWIGLGPTIAPRRETGQYYSPNRRITRPTKPQLVTVDGNRVPSTSTNSSVNIDVVRMDSES
jgi:hypothetical protein